MFHGATGKINSVWSADILRHRAGKRLTQGKYAVKYGEGAQVTDVDGAYVAVMDILAALLKRHRAN